MRSSRVALLAVAGLAAGVAVAALMPRGQQGSAVSTSTTMPSVTTTTAVWVDPRETRLGPTVVVAAGLEMEGDRVLFTYSLYPIVPLASFLATDDRPDRVREAAPASFTLTYPGGSSTARVLGPGQRAVRFEVPPGVTPAQVAAISVDSYWVAAPAGHTILLSPSSGAWVSATPGVRARILRVAAQAENYLVIVEMETEDILADELYVDGEGREWQASSYSQIGGQRWTLDFRGETLPDPVPLVVRGVGWVEVTGGGPVDITGVPR